MAKLTIGGVDYEVRPLTLENLIAVGEHYDAIQEFLLNMQPGKPWSPSERFAIAKRQLTIFLAGISLQGLSVEGMMRSATAPELDGLWKTYNALQVESGFMSKGEAEPAEAPAGESP